MARENRKDRERRFTRLKARKEALTIHPLVRASLAWKQLSAIERAKIIQKWEIYYTACKQSRAGEIYGEMALAIKKQKKATQKELLQELYVLRDAGDYIPKPSQFSPEDLDNGVEVKEYQKVLTALRDLDGEGYMAEIDQVFGGYSKPYRD